MNDQLKSLLHVHRFNHDYARRLVNDVADDRLCAQPDGCTPMNHPAWMLGHLVMADGLIVSVLGGQYTPPGGPSWNELFGPKSKPHGDRQRYPSKAELLAAMDDSRAAVEAAAAKFDMKKWNDPFPIEAIRKSFPTIGDGLTQLLTAHPGTHVGQVSSWRRAHGMAAV